MGISTVISTITKEAPAFTPKSVVKPKDFLVIATSINLQLLKAPPIIKPANILGIRTLCVLRKLPLYSCVQLHSKISLNCIFEEPIAKFKYTEIKRRHTPTIKVSVVRFSFLFNSGLTIFIHHSHCFPPYLLSFLLSFLDNSTSSFAISSEEIKPRDLAHKSRSKISTR